MSVAPLRKLLDPRRPLTYGIVQAGPNFEGGTPYIRPTDMTDTSGVLDESRLLRTSPDIAKAYARASLRAGDIVLSIGPSYGKVMLVPPSLEGANLTQGTARLAPGPGVFGRWLYWVLQARASTAFWGAVAAGGTFRALNLGPLGETPVSLRPCSEQRRVADFLDDRVARIDQIITARKAQIVGTQRRFEARRRNAVLGLSAQTYAIDLPWAAHFGVGWRVRRLSQVARMGTGHTPSRSEPDFWVGCDIPWLTTSDVHRFRRDEIDRIDDTAIKINEAGLANSAAVLHPAGTVALSRTASAGFSIVMDTDMATSQDFVTWSCTHELRPEFLLHVLRVMRPYLLGYLAMGSTHKTIYFPDLMDISVPLPSLTQQDQVIELVRVAADERASLSTAMERQIKLLQEYKQSLITAAVTGEIDVTTTGSGIQG